MKRFLVTIVTGLTLASSALASFPGGTYTIAPGENREIYRFGNMTGSVVIETDEPINVRWISTGEKKEVQIVSGATELRLPQKLDGRLEASNPNTLPATVRVSERTQVSNMAQSWEQFWGTVAGGHDFRNQQGPP